MAVDNVPWFPSTPGVEVPSEVARVLAYAATSGERGVIGGSSFRATAAATPNGTVVLAPGVGAIPSTYQGHSGQSYIVRGPTATSVPIAPTGSSGGRTDLIVVRVDDAALVGQTPGDLDTYEFAKPFVIQGGSENQAYPYVPIARVVVPASTATITNAMITDLREVVLAKERQVVRTYHLTDGQQTHIVSTAAHPAGQPFPQTATYPASLRTVRVPPWATQMEIRAEWFSVAVIAGSRQGQVWCNFGLTDGDNSGRIQPSRWSADDETSGRQHLTAIDTVPIPANYRGRDLIFSPRARRYYTPTQQTMMDASSAFALTVRFMERAD